ncbi:hypothetical protein [Saccharothrix sp. HUAS TT1]|uniref:hypothetical protein n=1 Tax=unclassified Saccharothrix TaxID=2593673 RepID=UPI00345C2A68
MSARGGDRLGPGDPDAVLAVLRRAGAEVAGVDLDPGPGGPGSRRAVTERGGVPTWPALDQSGM